jgi:hypothetical protein
MSSNAHWTTLSRIEGMPRTRTFLPPSFGISFLRSLEWDVLARDQLGTDLPEELLHSARLDVSEGHPVDARGSTLPSGHAVGFVESLLLADVHEQAPETPRRFRLRLGIHPSSQVLQTHERSCHPPLPSLLTQEHVQRGPIAPWVFDRRQLLCPVRIVVAHQRVVPAAFALT